MKYYAPIVIKNGTAIYDCLVSVDDGGCVDVSPFLAETPSTKALDGVVIITDAPLSAIPARNADESLERYASRLIGMEAHRALVVDPSGHPPVVIHAGFSVYELS